MPCRWRPRARSPSGLPEFYDASLRACHGLRTPPDLHILANADASVLPSVYVKTLGVRKYAYRSCTSTSGCATTPTAYTILCLRLIYLVRPPGLRHRSKTRYGWVASPYPTGTCTPQDTPSFARRDNDSDEPRLTATDRSGSEGSKLSSVGWSALIGFTFTHKQVP